MPPLMEFSINKSVTFSGGDQPSDETMSWKIIFASYDIVDALVGFTPSA